MKSLKRSTLLLSLALPLAAAASAAPAVETTKAQLRELAPTVTAAGQVQSRSGADMAAGVAGQLAWVAEPGTRLNKGEAIARMQRDELDLLRAEQVARVTRGELALKQSQRELERLRAAGNAVSRFQLDQSESAAELAKSDLDIARATLKQTDERLSRTELRAPFAGVVSERLKHAGEEVNRGEIVARYADTDHLEVRLFLPLKHVRAIAAGSTVKVLIDEREVAARVRAIVPVGDLRSQSFEALIDVPATVALTVGRSVRVELPLEAPQQALAVPRDALIIRSEGMAVYRVKAGKEAGKKNVQRVRVKPGVAAGAWVAVEGELQAQDDIVVRGAEMLHDGDEVDVIGEHKV